MIFSLLFHFLVSTAVLNTSGHSHSIMPLTEDVRVTRTFERVAGKNDYLVTVLIHASGIIGFGRLTEFFPPGVTASVVENGAASTNLANDRLKFIWVSLPDSPEIKVSYTITFPDNKLIMHYRGEFRYLSGNAATSYKLEPKDLKLIGE